MVEGVSRGKPDPGSTIVFALPSDVGRLVQEKEPQNVGLEDNYLTL